MPAFFLFGWRLESCQKKHFKINDLPMNEVSARIQRRMVGA